MSLLTRGFNEIESIVAKTMEYLSIPSVVGHEQFFLNHLYDDFKKLGLEAYKHSKILEIRGKDPYSAIICAHIDRHGLISIGNKEYVYAAQYMKEIEYGEENRSSRKELEAIAERFAGEKVFAYDPKTNTKLGEGVIEVCVPCMSDGDSLFFVQGMDEIEQGIPLAYARMARAYNGDLKGQIDNAVSLGVIHALYKAGFQGTTLFATEEEIGKSWLHLSEHLDKENIETQNLLVLDTSPYDNKTPAKEGKLILRNRDKSGVFNPEMVEVLEKRCKDLKQIYEVKDEVLLAAGKDIEDLGSTELGRLIQGTKERWSGATIQIPTTTYHTSNETTTRNAIRSYYRFLSNILIEDPIGIDIAVKEKI